MIQSTHPMTGDDPLSLAMFWAGALMAFTPLIGAGAVLFFWWRGRPHGRGRADPPAPPPTATP